MRTLAEMHDLKNYKLVQATPSSIIVIDVVVLGSITSRCSGNEPALLWKDQGSGGNRSYGSICVLFKYIKKLTKPILLVVFVFRLTQSKAVFVFPQKPPTPPPKKSTIIRELVSTQWLRTFTLKINLSVTFVKATKATIYLKS